MYKCFVFCLVFLIGLSVNAQTINLRGKVSNKAGTPISNAIVTLLRQKLADTTGADGSYSITGTKVAVLPPLVPQSEKISLNRGILELRLSNPSPVKVEIVDIKGNLLKKEMLQDAIAGVYRWDIAENSRTAKKMLIIHASIGGSDMTFQYLPLQSGKYALNSAVGSFTPIGGRLAKLAAAVDSLKTTANGFQTKVVTIDSYDKAVDFTLDSTTGTGCEGCGKTPPASGQATTISVDGANRQYILTLPSNYDSNKPYVLIFVPHPLGGTMSGTVSGGYHGLKSVSNNQAIFVAPQGLSTGGTTGFSNTNGVDIKFFKAMLDLFNSTLCIDQKRIFSTGFSFGGMMSFAVGCSMWDKFRAIAPNSGSFVSGCDSTKQGPIAVMQSHGKSDNVMPLSMGIIARDYFLRMNGCSKETKPVEPSAGNCVEYQGCKEGYPYIYCEFAGGHAPQNWQAAAIWKFFTETLK